MSIMSPIPDVSIIKKNMSGRSARRGAFKCAVLFGIVAILACGNQNHIVGRYPEYAHGANGNVVLDMRCVGGISDAEVLVELFFQNHTVAWQLFHGILPIKLGAHTNPERTVCFNLPPGYNSLLVHELKTGTTCEYGLYVPKSGKWYVNISFMRIPYNAPQPYFSCIQGPTRAGTV